jgi:Meckel syndrome type 1 protein
VLDTVRNALPNTVVDSAPDTAMVVESDTVMVPEPDTIAVPKPETAVVLTPETTGDIEPAPAVKAVRDTVRSVQGDAPAGVPSIPGDDDEPSPRLDLVASADMGAAPSVAARPAVVAVSSETESPVVDAPKGESREVTPPKVESPEGDSHTGETPKAESPAVRPVDVAPTAPRSDAPRTPVADMIPARRVVVNAVGDRPVELSRTVVLKPAVRADVSVDAPDAHTPHTHGEPARLSSAPAARPAGAPAAAAAAFSAAPERPMESAGTRPTPFAHTVAPGAGATRDEIPAATIAVVSGGVSGTPWHAAVTDTPVGATPAAATPNILLRPTADDGQPLESRLVEVVRWQAREGGGRVEIKLRPEFLGAVTVTVHVDGGVVKASLAAEAQATREVLQAEAGHLKSALEDQGFTLETFEVSDERDTREQEQPHQRPRQQPGPRRSARSLPGGASSGETFDVVM